MGHACEVWSSDEVGQLAGDFNAMTEQLVEQRDRMIQAETVAAWRELARRLAHELKNPLFPAADHYREFAALAGTWRPNSSTKSFGRALPRCSPSWDT